MQHWPFQGSLKDHVLNFQTHYLKFWPFPVLSWSSKCFTSQGVHRVFLSKHDRAQQQFHPASHVMLLVLVGSMVPVWLVLVAPWLWAPSHHHGSPPAHGRPLYLAEKPLDSPFPHSFLQFSLLDLCTQRE